MSFTLRGRIQTRLAAAVPALLVAIALQRWWAIELVALMLAIGLALDVVYDRAISYQPAWLALPLGAFELALVYGGMRLLGIAAPLSWALGLFGIAWASAQVAGHAAFPRLRLEYGESGGELGRAGALTAVAVAATVFGGLGAAYATRPPTVHLHGTVQGPLVITRSEVLTGGVVKGGIVVRANHVTIRHVTVVGGEYGIDVEHAQHVTIDHVRVVRSQLDGIRATDAGVMNPRLHRHLAGRAVRRRHPDQLFDGPADEHGRRLHRLRHPGGDLHPFGGGGRDEQPRDRDERARHSARRDVDGHGEPQHCGGR